MRVSCPRDGSAGLGCRLPGCCSLTGDHCPFGSGCSAGAAAVGCPGSVVTVNILQMTGACLTATSWIEGIDRGRVTSGWSTPSGQKNSFGRNSMGFRSSSGFGFDSGFAFGGLAGCALASPIHNPNSGKRIPDCGSSPPLRFSLSAAAGNSCGLDASHAGVALRSPPADDIRPGSSHRGRDRNTCGSCSRSSCSRMDHSPSAGLRC